MNLPNLFLTGFLLLVTFLNVDAQKLKGRTKLVRQYDAATKLYGYADEKGQLIIPYKYALAQNFSEGLAAVKINKEYPHDRWGFIDADGSTVLPFKFFEPTPFNNGLTKVSIDGRDYWMNRSQELFKGNQYLNYSEDDGLARISSVDNVNVNDEIPLFGYINKKGELKVPIKLKGASRFSEGLAAVFIDSAWGYMDTLGHVVISPRFKSAESFASGRAVVGVIQKSKQKNETDQTWYNQALSMVGAGQKSEQKKVNGEAEDCQWYMNASTNDYYGPNRQCAQCADCFVGVINKKIEWVIKPNINRYRL
jgi:WG containing repeat